MKKSQRVKKKCEAYRAKGSREKNKARRLRKHISLHPNDKQTK